MLNEALVAAERCQDAGFGLEVINMPWLNRADAGWLSDVVAPHSVIYVLEDHMLVGGLADRLLSSLVEHRALGGRTFTRLGVEDHPKCGTPAEVLRYHGIDGESLAQRLLAVRQRITSSSTIRLASTA
jgi:transketolase